MNLPYESGTLDIRVLRVQFVNLNKVILSLLCPFHTSWKKYTLGADF